MKYSFIYTKFLLTLILFVALMINARIANGQAALLVLIFGDKIASEKFHLSLDAGLNVANLLPFKKTELTLDSRTDVTVEQDLRDLMNTVDFGGVLEIGYAFEEVRKKRGIDIRLRYVLGFSEVFKEDSGFSANNSVFQAILTFLFVLLEEE